MKKLISIFLFIINYLSIINYLFSQNNKIDSLEIVLKTATDTTKVNILNQLSEEYVKKAPETAMQYAEQALSISEEKKYKKGIANALNMQGVFYSSKGNYEKSLESLNMSLAKREEMIIDNPNDIESKSFSARIMSNIGFVYVKLGDFDKANEYYLKALKIAESIKSNKDMILVLNFTANMYYTKGEYEKTIEFYLKSLKISEEVGDKKAIAKSLLNIGGVYEKQENYDEALKYFQNAFEMNEKLNNKNGMSQALNNIGVIYQRKKNYDGALEYYLKSLRIKEEIGDKSIIASSLLNIGIVHLSKKNYPKAIEYYERALKMNEEIGNKSGIANVVINLGNLYFKKADYNKAIEYLNKALVIAKEINSKEYLKNIYSELASANAKKNDFKSAYQFHQQYVNIKDTLFNEARSKSMADMQTKYETDKKKKEIQLLTKDKELQETQLTQQRIVIWSVGGGLFLVLILAFFIYRNYKEKKKANALLAEINIELEKLSIVASETDNAVTIANADGKIEWVNAGFTRMLGYSLEEYKNLKGEEIIKLSGDEKIEQLINDSVKAKKSGIFETLNTTKDGKEIWVQSTLTPILDEKTNVKKIVIIDTDITLRKHAEDEIRYINTEMTDSINYAKQIQTAILPLSDVIHKSLPQCFVLFKPKAIVSGDFYYFHNPNLDNDEAVLIAAADCTGHGVPGAFMSMIGNNLLNQIVIEKGFTKPSEILNNLHKGVRKALKQDAEGAHSRDGMDIALCSVNLKNNTIEYAGANRPLYIVSDGILTETKANKNPIGGLQAEDERLFTNHLFQLKKYDTVYFFSDGFADQFGGEKGKKFMTKNFQNLLLEIQPLSMDKQKEHLDNTMEKWRGNIEQIDDILVIGVRF